MKGGVQPRPPVVIMIHRSSLLLHPREVVSENHISSFVSQIKFWERPENTVDHFIGWSSATDPAEGGYSAPSDLVAGVEGASYPSPRTRSPGFGSPLTPPSLFSIRTIIQTVVRCVSCVRLETALDGCVQDGVERQ